MSRGSSRLRSPEGADPAGALAGLEARSASGFPHLSAARARTADSLLALRARLADAPRDTDAALVLFGSWGRWEVTPGSDTDWAVLVGAPPRGTVRPAAADLAGRLGHGPAEGGSFGRAVFADELTDHVGLRADSWDNLTLRMLLLLESVAVAGEEVHARCRDAVLATYLREVDPFRPPRFFLNDLIRYWRTIAVDFEGKARRAPADEASGPAKWASRLVKLRTSRKVLFAGGLLPILLCHLHPAAEIPGFLRAQLEAPATDRLAHAFCSFGAEDAGLRALGAYDRWLGLLADPGMRGELERLPRDQVEHSTTFREARRLGDELQAGLLALLFDTPLRALVREYGIF
jgi:hypothetical protein